MSTQYETHGSYIVVRESAYFGRTTPRVAWTVKHIGGRIYGTFTTLRAAREEAKMNMRIDERIAALS